MQAFASRQYLGLQVLSFLLFLPGNCLPDLPNIFDPFDVVYGFWFFWGIPISVFFLIFLIYLISLVFLSLLLVFSTGPELLYTSEIYYWKKIM